MVTEEGAKDPTIHLFDQANNLQCFSAGTTIFKAGDRRNFMYVVVDGEVDLIVNNTLVETVQPGGIFGEMALIEENERVGTAVARTDCKLATLDENRFSFLIEQTPFFALKVMRILARRLCRMNAQIK